ncbi:HlyD family secretion protein [Roseomonas sp. DSM 102946]|nr:HlyD family secretion protein [Roseomonas sp. DSM 102946]
MVKAKAISLSVRPVRSADLCFPMAGIIEFQPDNLLGQAVQSFSREALLERLEPKATLPPDSNLIVTMGPNTKPDPGKGVLFGNDDPVPFGPDRIESEIGRSLLSRLRAADIATQLVQAASWYGLKSSADLNDAAVASKRTLLGNNLSDPNSVPRLLDALAGQIRSRGQQIEQAHVADVEDSGGFSRGTGGSSGTTNTTGGQSFDTASSITNIGREYRSPLLDNRLSHLRAEISLRQERHAARRMVALHTPRNVDYERAMAAAEVRKIQVTYLDTFLLAPFSGVITGVFRNLGDFVAAGQPVMRLEDDTGVFLVGTIKCRGLISIGNTVKVTTTLFGAPGGVPVEIEGFVSAIRGHDAIDEQWNVLIRCDNVANGKRILPINYSFDFDATELEITP